MDALGSAFARPCIRTADFGCLDDGGPPAVLCKVRNVRLYRQTAAREATVSAVIGFLASHLQRQVTLQDDAQAVTPEKMAWIREVAGKTLAIMIADACQGFIAWRPSPPPKRWQEAPGHPYQRVVMVTPATHDFYLVYRDHLATRPGQDTAPSVIAVPTYSTEGRGVSGKSPFAGLGVHTSESAQGVVTGLMVKQVWDRRDTSVRVFVNTLPHMGDPVVPLGALFKDATFTDTMRVAEAYAVQSMARPGIVLGDGTARDAVASRAAIIPDPTGRSMRDSLAIQQQRNLLQMNALQDAVESNAWARPTVDGESLPGGMMRQFNPYLGTTTLEAPYTRFEALQRATVVPTGQTVLRGPEPSQPSNVLGAVEALRESVCAQFRIPSSVLFMHKGSGGRSTGAADVGQDGLFRTVDHHAEWLQFLVQSMYDACVRPMEDAKLKRRVVAAGRFVQLRAYERGVMTLAHNLAAVTKAAQARRPPPRDGDSTAAVVTSSEDDDAPPPPKPKAKDKDVVVDVPGWIEDDQRRNLQSKEATEALRGLPEFTAYHEKDTTRVLVHRMQKNARVAELLESKQLAWKAGAAMIATDMGISEDSLVKDPEAELLRVEVARARALAAVELETKRAEAELQVKTEERLAAIQAKYAPKPETAPAAAKPKPAAAKPAATKPKPAAKPAAAKPKPAAKEGDDKTDKLRAQRDKKREARRGDTLGMPSGKRRKAGVGGGGSSGDEDPTKLRRGPKTIRV